LLTLAFGLLFVGLPNRHGESPRFLQFHAAPMIYPGVVLLFFSLGCAGLISWAAS
jgi:hypothetical protein